MSKTYTIILLAFVAILNTSFANAQLLIRPHVGVGSLSSDSGNTKVSHIGVRILAAVAPTRNFGLELSQFTREDNTSFQSVGIVLEQKKFDWFSMSIATVGYFNYENNTNVAGFMNNLGWEPIIDSRFKPFVTYRQDIVFAKETAVINSISAGLGITF